MKVVLLAAGRSKRLKPVKDKNFLQFLGTPLLLYQLEQLTKAGFDDFIIVGGEHNLEQIADLVKDLEHDIKVVKQENLDEGMAGAIESVEKIVKKGPLLVVSGNDVVESTAFEQIMAAHRLAEHGLLLAKEVDEYFPGGYLDVDSDFFCKKIVEKPGAGKEPSNLVNIVVHYFGQSEDLFKAVKEAKSTNDDRYEVALDNMMKGGAKIRAIPYEGYWQAIKLPWHVLDLMDYFLKGLSSYEISDLSNKNIEISDMATIKGGVYLEDGVKIFDNAVIVGPAYIGKNTVIATNAMVRESHIGEGCVVGFGTEVARSYIGNNVWTHTNYIGDSLIGNNCSFGAGTVIGNLRLDENNIGVNIKERKIDSGRNKFGIVMGDDVRAGINTSFMPGIKIGNNTMIGAGITVGQDIPDNKFAYAKTELIIKDNKAKLDAGKRDEMQKKLNQT